MQPIDPIITGNGLNSQGFLNSSFAMSGLGLNTIGFISACADIWTSGEDDVTTSWSDVPSFQTQTVETCID